MNLLIWIWDRCLEKEMHKFKTWDKDKFHPVLAVAPLHTLLAFMLIKLQVILMIRTGERRSRNNKALSVPWSKRGSWENIVTEEVCP